MAETSSRPGRLRRVGQTLHTGFAEFFRLEIAGSVVLLVATVAALIVANTNLYPAVGGVLHVEAGFQLGGLVFHQSLLHWIDDGLMVLFFFVVGLEIKREVVVGELSKPRQAALPIIAALGGMLLPALIYFALNTAGPASRGWGIPMATDIAFALGALALLAGRAPRGLRLFLTALAIADDLGAIIVIAVFYAHGFSVPWLLGGLALLGVLVVLNRAGVDSPVPYVLIGLVVWFAFLSSGIHATIAGVLVAFTIPSDARVKPLTFVRYARERLDDVEAADVPGEHVLECDTQQEALFELRHEANSAAAPLQRLEHALLPWTTFLVLPLFAFANAGVRLVGYDFGRMLTQPVFLGIFFGLLVGKTAGITAFSFAAVKTRASDLPGGVAWRDILGGGVLGAIGFTMSLFIANLAFKDPLLLGEAKLAILLTSTVAAAIGYAFLRFFSSAAGTGGAPGTGEAAGTLDPERP